MVNTDFLRKSLLMLGGMLIWAVHFAFVYGFNTMACARQFSSIRMLGFDIVPFVIAVATIAALIAVLGLILLAWRPRRARQRDREDETPVDAFMRFTVIAVAALSLVAIAWTGLPAFLVSPCG